MWMTTTTTVLRHRAVRGVGATQRFAVAMRGENASTRWLGRGAVTQFSTEAGGHGEQELQKEKQQEDKPGFLDTVVNKLNESIRSHPGETIAVLFASDIGSIGAMYGLLSISGIEFSPEFALAFAASRPFRRVRLPLDIAAAAAVAKIFPAFSRVKLSELMNVMPGRQKAALEATGATSASVMSKSVDKVFGVIDSYGAAYMMGSRLMGVGVVTALYVLIKQGVDVMPILATLGVEEVGTALGSYAAAVVFSSAFYPVTLGVTGYIAPLAAKARRSLLP
ncbi:hypothetical protein Poli38472_000873 [Pythium oligandrum]|uniref:Transmembrane protein n=1 Tax=Pythium oligandrum TaxID=41045 RepID=A0A8K1CCI1_PYTOL|nr:hypothetical protein Poli38472_000873 [Pythium oligandrum]|eukprot:TMW60831.1 hypothetical protein Poli38472_000873 [Pythium oligandrum]